jgi:hypothetical protein
MNRTLLACAVTAALTFAVTLFAVDFAARNQTVQTIRLENSRVCVSESVSQPGATRPRHVRASDQVLVFLDDCRYERTDPSTGGKSIQVRKSGDVIWHSKGEEAPVLVNAGTAAYRTLVIELK